MKKLYRSFLSLVTFLSLLLSTKPAYAGLCPEGESFNKLCDLKAGKIGGAVGSIITVLIILAIILALIYLVYGGIKWITSGGEKAKLDAARGHLTAAVIGLIISLLAYAIVIAVTGYFDIDIRRMKIPTLLD